MSQHNKTELTEQRQLFGAINLMNSAILTTLKNQAAILKGEIFALYIAVREPATPWYAKAFAGLVIAYALSPIDLIPDFIPILGYLDDLVLLPLGIWFVLKMIPQEVMVECRAKAAARKSLLPRNWWVAVAIIVLWLLAAILLGRYLLRYLVENQNWNARFGY